MTAVARQLLPGPSQLGQSRAKTKILMPHTVFEGTAALRDLPLAHEGPVGHQSAFRHMLQWHDHVLVRQLHVLDRKIVQRADQRELARVRFGLVPRERA